MLTVSIFNFKGGTGKSTTAINLGAALAIAGYPTLLIDLDGQRTLSFGLGVDGQTPTALDWLTSATEVIPLNTSVKGLSVIPGDIGLFRLSTDADLFTPALKRLIPLGLDVALLDCPPGLGVASVQAILSSDRVLVPTLCEPAALKGLAEAVGLIRDEDTQKPIEVLRTRYRPRLVLTREADDLLVTSAEDLGYRLLHAKIPENIPVAESIAQQQPVLEYAPRSTGALAYTSLCKECVKLWRVKP
jgi:chromosome partitioning protein